MKVLVTGICGFVGRWIAQGLVESSSQIELVGLDNLGRPGSELNRESVRRLGAKFIHGDMRLASDIDSLPAVDWVIDCAATTSVLAGTPGHSSARQLVEHNLIGSLNLLEYCRAHRSGLILLSTSRVYSIEPLKNLPLREVDGAYQPEPGAQLPPGVTTSGIDESFSTTPPISIYGATKRSAEIMAMEYATAYQFPLRINRCGVMAGAGQFGRADQGIFSFWVHSHLQRRPLQYIGFGGTGYQVRDCLHPLDVASLAAEQMQCGDDRQKPVIANISGGVESARSLHQLTAWCDARFGPHPVTGLDQQRPFDLPWVVLDSALGRQAWGWRPSLTTDQILDEIAEHAQQHPDWLEQTS